MTTPAPADAAAGAPSRDRLRSRDFALLAAFIEDYAGIKMPPSKTTLLEGRSRRRVRVDGMANLNQYCQYLFERGGLKQEAVHLIDAVSTNKTDFFREPEQFQLLERSFLPELLATPVRQAREGLAFWSAAASTGAEAYTLAMVLAEYARANAPFRSSILATDISTEVLATARQGIYPQDMIAPVAAPLRQRYLLRSRDRGRGLVRIVPELRAMVRFGRLNLMDERYDVQAAFDVVFCRNVLIYFHRDTQRAVLRRLCAHLRPGGFLFLGHSESITGLELPLVPIRHNSFRRE